jgi:hypothetical protein
MKREKSVISAIARNIGKVKEIFPPVQKGEDRYLKFFITGGSIARRE